MSGTGATARVGAGIALVALLAAAVGAAEDARVSVQRAADGVQVQAEADIDAPVALVWETLTDYEQLPAFIPGISRSKVTVLLRYAGLLEPDFDLPPLVGAAALRAMVREQFSAMVREIRRRAAARNQK